MNVAIWEKEIPFNPNWVTWKESSFKSVLGYQKEDFESVIKNLGSGKSKNHTTVYDIPLTVVRCY